jgi:AAA15 family ATPase/GTPase
MKTRLNIKNFRIFDEDGAIFEINPITILTGCNSSGKSSMVKAVMLLNSFLGQIKKDIENGNEVDFSKYKLDFTQYPMNLLGRFDKVVNNRSESRKITIEYTVYSLIISKDVNVKLVFSANENDDLNNGYLENINISIDEDIFYDRR